MLLISNIPAYFNDETIKKHIKTIIQNNKGKILAPHFDIFVRQGQAVLLVDGWDVTELVEEEVIEKIEH